MEDYLLVTKWEINKIDFPETITDEMEEKNAAIDPFGRSTIRVH